MSEEPFFLDDILQPLRISIRFSGLHNGFFPPVEEHRAFYITRCVSTVVIVFFLLSYGVYETVQLGFQFWDMSNILEFSVTVSGGVVSYVVVNFVIQFYGNKKQYSEFFKEWKQVEMFVDYRISTKKQLIKKGISIFIYGMILSGFFGTGFINSLYPDNSIFLSHWEILREKLGIHILIFIMSLWGYFSTFFMLFSESVPVLFFHEAGCMIEKLGRELENISLSTHREHSDLCVTNENPFLLIWKKYESIQRSVDRANKLFGFTMIINQFIFICLACLIIYVILADHNSDMHEMFFVQLTLVVFRIVISNRLMSHLYLSGVELKKIAAGTLSEKWFLLSQEDRDIVACFLSRVDGSLAACPLNLYTVDPTNILSLLTLHISYVIVLLQSH